MAVAADVANEMKSSKNIISCVDVIMSAMPNSSNATAILCTIYAHLMHLIFIFIILFSTLFSSSSFAGWMWFSVREKKEMTMKSTKKMSATFKEEPAIYAKALLRMFSKWQRGKRNGASKDVRVTEELTDTKWWYKRINKRFAFRTSETGRRTCATKAHADIHTSLAFEIDKEACKRIAIFTFTSKSFIIHFTLFFFCVFWFIPLSSCQCLPACE